MRTESSVGSERASSRELVCSDWVPPSTAAIACNVTRTTLLSGCGAVRVQHCPGHAHASDEGAGGNEDIAAKPAPEGEREAVGGNVD